MCRRGRWKPSGASASPRRCARTSRRLPERRLLPHHRDRNRACAYLDPVARHAVYRDGGTGHRLADAGAPTPDQSDFPRAAAAGACSIAAAHPHCASQPGRGFRPERNARGRQRRRSRFRRQVPRVVRLPGRLRRRQVHRAEKVRRQAGGHPGQSTYIRAPHLLSRMPREAAWLYQMRNPRRCGTASAIPAFMP